MHSRYALMACLSLLLLQTSPETRGNASVTAPNPSAPPAALPATKIIAHGVDLEPDATTISSEALPVLSEAAELLGKDGPPVVISVDPPTDGYHSDTYRQLLRRRLAKAIRRYLVEDGIAPDRVAFPADAGSAIATADASHSRPMELHVP